MTARERLTARLAGKPVDKIPNLNIAMSLVAKQAGVNYRDYAQDYRKLVEGNLICAEKFGFDALCAISDPMREAAAFGAQIVFPENGVPYSKPPILAEKADVSLLQLVDPMENERTLDRIKAVEFLREKAGNEYPIIGWVEGVLAEAADLRGINDFMVDLAMEEPWIPELFEIIFQQQCRFAKAQVEAGADFIGVGNAVASLIGPIIYENYALEYDKKIVRYIHDLGAKVKLHICGNIQPLFPYFEEIKPDILDIDWVVSFSEAVKHFSGTGISVCGNVDPVAVLLQGTTETVEKEVGACLAVADETTLLAAGCEVPADTPEGNLVTMNQRLYQQ